MAKAEKIVPKPVPSTVVLTLSEDEALLVRDVVGSITGSSNSRRKHADTVYFALAAVDLGDDAGVRRADMSGTVNFTTKLEKI